MRGSASTSLDGTPTEKKLLDIKRISDSRKTKYRLKYRHQFPTLEKVEIFCRRLKISLSTSIEIPIAIGYLALLKPLQSVAMPLGFSGRPTRRRWEGVEFWLPFPPPQGRAACLPSC
jgi:hypothetical protein